MKVLEKFVVPAAHIDEFIKAHIHDDMQVEYSLKTNAFTIRIISEYTKPEFNMGVLRTMADYAEGLTAEERNACDYAISCIKTLVDMGVIK